MSICVGYTLRSETVGYPTLVSTDKQFPIYNLILSPGLIYFPTFFFHFSQSVKHAAVSLFG